MNKRIGVCGVLLALGVSGLTAWGNDYYVDASKVGDLGAATSWATAKQTIQAAVDLARDGDTVWVQDGTYALGSGVASGSTQTNRVCITNSIILRSLNGPDVTFIQGAAGSNGSNDVDSVRGVFMATNSLLTGFTVSGGYTIPEGEYPVRAAPGAGVYLTDGAVVSNCTIRGNSSLASGGGVYLANGGEVVDCTISENSSYSAGGGVFMNYGGTLNDCMISNNVNYGYNGGGGVGIEGGAEVNRCVVSDNESGTGAGVAISYGGTLNNCLIIYNTATVVSDYDGGGGVNGSESTLNNCTLFGNHTAGVGGGFYSGMMGANILNNCIVWGNTAATNANLGLSEWGGDAANNCCVPEGEGITNGVNGCVTSDPLFVDTASGDYQLQVSSLCVNAGINDVPTDPYDATVLTNITALSATDLAGNARVNNGTVDIGAYEQTATLASFVITTTAGANGTLSPANPTVYQGMDQEISIQPDTGYQIDSLSVDGSAVPVVGSYTFTNVQATHTISATFAPAPHVLTVNNGSGDGSYINAASVGVSADAAGNGTRFSHWMVVPAEYTNNLGSAFSATTIFTMPAEAIELTAVFEDVVEVKNLVVVQRPGTKLVDIYYDLFCGVSTTAEVSLSISNSTVEVEANTLSGDIGAGVATGSSHSILWDMGADWNGQVADLTFTVLGISSGLSAYSDSDIHGVDSRNYTLTVSSADGGVVESKSYRGYYYLGRSAGGVRAYPNSDTKLYSNSDRNEQSFTSYRSSSIGIDYRFTAIGGSGAVGLAPGASGGYGHIQVDPKNGTLNARASSHNRGGPKYWIDRDGDRRNYSIYNSWGTGGGEGGTRRCYEITGTTSFQITITVSYGGELSSEQMTSAYADGITIVSLVKDANTYFQQMEEMSWGAATDLYSATNSYDWFFGEGQEVVEFLGKVRHAKGLDVDQEGEVDLSGLKVISFEVHPGDLIVVDDLISVSTMTMNPLKLLDSEPKARVDDFSLTSELFFADGSGIVEANHFQGETIGDPTPSVGVHSNYCWQSAVTCAVNYVSSYTNTGWTGTGSVPATGSSSSTGGLVLSVPNSSIDWNWEFSGYQLSVLDGEGSGIYSNGAPLLISANPTNFYRWSGDFVDDLEDAFSPVTSLRMPADYVLFSPVYRMPEMHVNAAMPDDSLDGTSWATAKKTIQAAVDLVASNGTVWVTNGVYDAGGAVALGKTEMNRVYMDRPMTVRSVNGADVTTIRGAIGSPGSPDDPDSIYAVRGVYMANNSILSGFSIESSCAYSANGSGNGSGIWMGTGSVVSNCVIHNNQGAYAGGGVYLEMGATLDSCTVESNTSGISGGGVCVQDGTVNCCIIKDNLSDYEGGGVYLSGTLNNSVLDGNQATHSGGGLFIQSGTANNCTIVNSEGRRGAAIRLNGEGSAIYNSILLYNTDWDDRFSDGIQNDGGEMQRCMIGFVYGVGVEAGILYSGGNVYVHPSLFSLKGTYELWEHSAGVDWGDNAHAPEGKALGGNARVINGRVDLGAYETGGEMPDANGNDISDDWEEFFYGANPPSASSMCSNGVNTVKEAYVAGIDPTDPNSRFFVQVDPVTGALSWPLAYGRTYSIFWTPDLSTPFSWVADVSWTDGFYLDAEHDSEGAGFYKVEVQ